MPPSVVRYPEPHRARNIKGGSHDQAARGIERSGSLAAPVIMTGDPERRTTYPDVPRDQTTETAAERPRAARTPPEASHSRACRPGLEMGRRLAARSRPRCSRSRRVEGHAASPSQGRRVRRTPSGGWHAAAHERSIVSRRVPSTTILHCERYIPTSQCLAPFETPPHGTFNAAATYS